MQDLRNFPQDWSFAVLPSSTSSFIISRAVNQGRKHFKLATQISGGERESRRNSRIGQKWGTQHGKKGRTISHPLVRIQQREATNPQFTKRTPFWSYTRSWMWPDAMGSSSRYQLLFHFCRISRPWWWYTSNKMMAPDSTFTPRYFLGLNAVGSRCWRDRIARYSPCGTTAILHHKSRSRGPGSIQARRVFELRSFFWFPCFFPDWIFLLRSMKIRVHANRW